MSEQKQPGSCTTRIERNGNYVGTVRTQERQGIVRGVFYGICVEANPLPMLAVEARMLAAALVAAAEVVERADG